jgi:hypothetical protein
MVQMVLEAFMSRTRRFRCVTFHRAESPLNRPNAQ